MENQCAALNALLRIGTHLISDVSCSHNMTKINIQFLNTRGNFDNCQPCWAHLIKAIVSITDYKFPAALMQHHSYVILFVIQSCGRREVGHQPHHVDSDLYV